MKIVLIVNESPWGSTRAVTACRLARAALEAGHQVPVVFFREEGVYNAISGTEADSGTPDLFSSWSGFAENGGTELMVCQSSCRRRLAGPVASPFREAGLAEFADRLASCDRVLTL